MVVEFLRGKDARRSLYDCLTRCYVKPPLLPNNQVPTLFMPLWRRRGHSLSLPRETDVSGHRTRQAEKEEGGGKRIRLRLPFPRMQVHVNINPITTFLSVLTPSLRSIKVCAVLPRPPLPFSADADNDIGEMLISTFGLVASCKRAGRF